MSRSEFLERVRVMLTQDASKTVLAVDNTETINKLAGILQCDTNDLPARMATTHGLLPLETVGLEFDRFNVVDAVGINGGLFVSIIEEDEVVKLKQNQTLTKYAIAKAAKTRSFTNNASVYI